MGERKRKRSGEGKEKKRKDWKVSSTIIRIVLKRKSESVSLSGVRTQEVYVKVKSLSHVWLSATPSTVARQAPLSMEFSKQKYWSG